MKAGIGSSAPGADGALAAHGLLDHGGGVDALYTVRPAPETRKVYLSTEDGASWNIVAGVLGAPDADGNRAFDSAFEFGGHRRFAAERRTPRRSTSVRWGRGWAPTRASCATATTSTARSR
ncbi:hypothetical protein SCALM49S_10259 [Streptomyces californicus]